MRTCSRSGAPPCTRGSWRPSRRSTRTGWPSRWTGWRTMRCGASDGTRRSAISARRAPRPPRAARIPSRRAHAIAAPLGDVALRVAANFYLAQALHSLGDYALATACTRRNAVALAGIEQQRFALSAFFVHSLSWQAWGLAELGEFADGEEGGAAALEVAGAIDRPELWVATSLGVGGLHLRRGDLRTAIPMLEHGVEVCRRWDLPRWFAALAASVGHA